MSNVLSRLTAGGRRSYKEAMYNVYQVSDLDVSSWHKFQCEEEKEGEFRLLTWKRFQVGVIPYKRHVEFIGGSISLNNTQRRVRR